MSPLGCRQGFLGCQGKLVATVVRVVHRDLALDIEADAVVHKLLRRSTRANLADSAFQNRLLGADQFGPDPELQGIGGKREASQVREEQVFARVAHEANGSVGSRAVAVSRIISQADLFIVHAPVVIRVNHGRICSNQVFVNVLDAIAVEVFVRIGDTVVIGILVKGVGVDQVFDQVAQAVAVRIVVQAISLVADFLRRHVRLVEVGCQGAGTTVPDGSRIELVFVTVDNHFLAVHVQGEIGLHGSAWDRNSLDCPA